MSDHSGDKTIATCFDPQTRKLKIIANCKPCKAIVTAEVLISKEMVDALDTDTFSALAEHWANFLLTCVEGFEATAIGVVANVIMELDEV